MIEEPCRIENGGEVEVEREGVSVDSGGSGGSGHRTRWLAECVDRCT